MASNTVLFTERRHVSTKHSFYNLIGEGQSNVITMFGNNVGIGTSTPRSKLDIAGDMKFCGIMYDEEDNAMWIPGSTLQWMDTSAPALNSPSGATLSNLDAKASYRHIGNEVVYNFSTNNLITAPATVSTDIYTLTLPEPLETSAYASNTVIGDLLLSVTNANSTLTTTFKAYALVGTDNTKAKLRYLNGTTDASMAEFPIYFTFRLQGTLTYASQNIANVHPIPTTAIPASFAEDQNGRVAFNTGEAASARFDVKEDSATYPALKVTQAGIGDILQVVDGATPVLVVKDGGHVGIGTTNPIEALHVQGTVQATLFSGSGASLTALPASSLAGQVAVASGGTGGATLAANKVLVGNGTATMLQPSNLHWDNANNRLGINATSPGQVLHVVGDTRIEGNLTVNGTQTIINTNVGNTEQMIITNDGTGPALIVDQIGAQPVLEFRDDGVPVMKIVDGGNVGIGTTEPLQRLHVQGNILASGTVTGTSFTGNASTATKLQTARTINGQPFDGSANITVTSGTPATLSRGTYLTGANFNGSTATTWAVDATNASTASKVVARDASGNFSAGIVTAALSGNASTATTLQTARTINGQPFDGSANITVTSSTPATLTRGTYLTGADFNGSTATTWAVDATNANTGSKIVARDASGNFNAGAIYAASGSAAAPSYSWTSDTNTGLYSPGADIVGLSTGGAERLRVLANGNVGIGTTAPQTQLDVAGASTSVYDHVWTSRHTYAGHTRGMTWAPQLSLFAAVSAGSFYGKNILTSPDGITWTTRTGPTFSWWSGMAWSPQLTLFAAVASANTTDGTGLRVMTSPDGINWTSRSAPTASWTDVVWAPVLSIFVAVAGLTGLYGSGATAQSSANGNVMTSPDGFTWTARTPANVNSWSRVAWAAELTLFVAVAAANRTGASTTERVMTSPDGITWTSRTTPAKTFYGVAWAPQLSLFVAVGDAGYVMTSPNGITWTEGTTPTTNPLRSVVWAPEISTFVAVGHGAQVITSPNGINWTLRTSPSSAWQTVTWAPELSRFVVGVSSINNNDQNFPNTSPIMTSDVTFYNGTLRFGDGKLGLGRTAAYQLDLSSDGARKLTSSSWLTGSDARLKQDIQTADYDKCYNTMSNLELRHFAWREDIAEFAAANDRHVVGWIAQEVQEHYPKAVRTLPESYGMSNVLVLDNSQIYATMYGTIKKLMAQVSAHDDLLTSLKSET